MNGLGFHGNVYHESPSAGQIHKLIPLAKIIDDDELGRHIIFAVFNDSERLAFFGREIKAVDKAIPKTLISKIWGHNIYGAILISNTSRALRNKRKDYYTLPNIHAAAYNIALIQPTRPARKAYEIQSLYRSMHNRRHALRRLRSVVPGNRRDQTTGQIGG
jgi:hypothetical protein